MHRSLAAAQQEQPLVGLTARSAQRTRSRPIRWTRAHIERKQSIKSDGCRVLGRPLSLAAPSSSLVSGPGRPPDSTRGFGAAPARGRRRRGCRSTIGVELGMVSARGRLDPRAWPKQAETTRTTGGSIVAEPRNRAEQRDHFRVASRQRPKTGRAAHPAASIRARACRRPPAERHRARQIRPRRRSVRRGSLRAHGRSAAQLGIVAEPRRRSNKRGTTVTRWWRSVMMSPQGRVGRISKRRCTESSRSDHRPHRGRGLGRCRGRANVVSGAFVAPTSSSLPGRISRSRRSRLEVRVWQGSECTLRWPA